MPYYIWKTLNTLLKTKTSASIPISAILQKQFVVGQMVRLYSADIGLCKIKIFNLLLHYPLFLR